jgi:fructuronate reductase
MADAMVEPKIDALRAATANASDVRSHVEAILRGGFVPDDLVQHTPFVDRVVQFPELILTGGVRAAAAEALAAGKSAA